MTQMRVQVTLAVAGTGVMGTDPCPISLLQPLGLEHGAQHRSKMPESKFGETRLSSGRSSGEFDAPR